MHAIEVELEKRILILDGAMGTMVQQFHLSEKDYRNKALRDHVTDLKGNTDLLNITRPDVIQNIHEQYLEAGADIISTNTFGANLISQADYHMTGLVAEINYQGARLAKIAAEKFSVQNSNKPRFVAGAMGPTTKLASISPTVTDPGFRSVTFDALVHAYTHQAKALIAGGIDLILLETITDTLNAKAALFALKQLFEETGKKYPIMVSGTITDASGRILSGQTIEAFLISIAHAPILAVGLNCALGAAELRPYIQTLHRISPFYLSTHPNAGLPNQFGGYDQKPPLLANLIQDFARNGWLNIVGGCCGTTPAHIAAIAQAVAGLAPRNKFANKDTKQHKTYTSSTVKTLIAQWKAKEEPGIVPTFNQKELLTIIAQIEDKESWETVQHKFLLEKQLYHTQQAMLLQANLYGRYQYLKAENKLVKLL